MLTGTFRYSLDAKNRLFIPAKHREYLGEEIVLARDIRGQRIKVCSVEEWDNYLKPILNSERKLSEQAIRFLMRSASVVTPDSQGRVVIPTQLIEYAGIAKDTCIVGCYHWAEIWAAEKFDEEVDKENNAAILAELEALGL